VILSLVDWRTRLLPTYVIAPSYAAVVALVLLGALVDQDRSRLWAALVGWAVMGGLYLLLWLIYPAGMGYGDVRLAGLFGLALGYVGPAPVFVGAWLGFLLGGVGGLVLSRVGKVTRKAYPMGPFMTAGVILGVLVGGPLASGLGY
jgi:leader peptidase (prepilin peptidase)/N-methyltransferase